MMRRWLQSVISILIIGMGLASPAQAQESVVPDLTGLSIPAAAAQLNAVGLRLGTQQALPLGADPSQAGRVASQSLAPGDLTAAGVTVDLQVYREPNMSVIFDDNDLTLVNRSQNLLDLNGLSFQAQDGTGASFAAVRWSGVLRPSQCTGW
jgi:beta-lactam-binding protein with PASTA domain